MVGGGGAGPGGREGFRPPRRTITGLFPCHHQTNLIVVLKCKKERLFLSLFGQRALTNDLQAREKLAIWKTVMK